MSPAMCPKCHSTQFTTTTRPVRHIGRLPPVLLFAWFGLTIAGEALLMFVGVLVARDIMYRYGGFIVATTLLVCLGIFIALKVRYSIMNTFYTYTCQDCQHKWYYLPKIGQHIPS
jgi:hypothetical protein